MQMSWLSLAAEVCRLLARHGRLSRYSRVAWAIAQHRPACPAQHGQPSQLTTSGQVSIQVGLPCLARHIAQVAHRQHGHRACGGRAEVPHRALLAACSEWAGVGGRARRAWAGGGVKGWARSVCLVRVGGGNQARCIHSRTGGRMHGPGMRRPRQPARVARQLPSPSSPPAGLPDDAMRSPRGLKSTHVTLLS